MSSKYDVVIVGAGHAGAQAAIALRQQGFKGTIALVGEEPELPYERPPLSKDYLAGDKPFERLLIRPAKFWAERGIAMLLGRRVISVDADAYRIVTADGMSLEYGSLVWATGGVPRRLSCSGSDLGGVHSIRARADVDRLIDELPHVHRVVVIGGGYIGLEAAAVLTKLGKSVTLLEALPRVLARVAGEPLSRFYEDEHRRQGVDLRTGVTVASLEGGGGRVVGVRLVGGMVLPADLVIVGIGIAPAVAPLLAAGANGGNGVDVDSGGSTSLPGVYAIGDCAAHPSRFAESGRVRLESVQNANDMAAVVAKRIVGEAAVYEVVPWFWSIQYDLKLQTVGLSNGHDEVVLRGSPDARSFSIVYLRAGKVIALDCVNATKDYVQGRSLLISGSVVSPTLLADTAVQLKEHVWP